VKTKRRKQEPKCDAERKRKWTTEGVNISLKAFELQLAKGEMSIKCGFHPE
jgi:hypothetical protein